MAFVLQILRLSSARFTPTKTKLEIQNRWTNLDYLYSTSPNLDQPVFKFASHAELCIWTP